MRRRLLRTWELFSGLVTLADVLGFVGFWLYKGTLRRTMGVGIALAGLVFLGKLEGAQFELTVKQALTGTTAILLISCLGGLALMMVSGSFSKSALQLAEVKGFNLLEEMKKHRVDYHRDELWLRVYRYEQARFPLEHHEAERRLIEAHRPRLRDLCNPNERTDFSRDDKRQYELVMREIGVTEVGWRIAFDYAMQIPMGAAELRYRLRWNLAAVKDWYDGAPFHHTDTKLAQQFDAGGDLVEAKRLAGYGLWETLVEARRRFTQRLWFRVITRAVQLRTAQACRRLDQTYPDHHFTIDHILWPSRLVDDKLREECGDEALAELIETRRTLFAQVFHEDLVLAQRLMQKAVYPVFAAATELRRRIDPRYITGELDEKWSDDVHRYDKAFRHTAASRRRRIDFRRAVQAEQTALRRFLEMHAPAGRADGFLERRALRVAFHVDHDGFKRKVIRGGAPQSILPLVDDIVRQAERFNRALLAVRVHHELARLELQDYTFYLERILGEKPPEDPDAPSLPPSRERLEAHAVL